MAQGVATERTAKARAKREGWADWIRCDADLIAARNGCRFDITSAEHSCTFFRRFLKHTKGEFSGRPFDPIDWERDALSRIYGWKRSDGTRRFRRVLIMMGRRGGKTVFAAGLSLYSLCCDNEQSGEVYPVAASIPQAGHLYRAAYEMVGESPDLLKRVQRMPSTKRMFFPATKSTLAVLTPDPDRARGINPSCLIVDEVVALPNRLLIDSLRYASGSRRQPLTVYLSTAGWDKQAIIGELYEYGCNVRDGRVVDDSFLAIIHEAKPEDDPSHPETWKKANPSLGVALRLETVEEEYREAQSAPRKMAAFKRERLNIWTSTAHAFLDINAWDKCSTKRQGETPMEWRKRMLSELQGEPCYIGLDLSQTRDLTAAVAIFPTQPGYIVIPWVWCPEEMTRRNERPEIDGLIADGFIQTTPGNAVDHSAVEAKVLELRENHRVLEVAYDRYGAYPMIQTFIGEGIECTPVAQNSATLNSPTRELERLVMAGELDHGDNPALRWMASNVEVKENAGAQLLPVKPKTAKKIDAVSALITALARAMVSEAVPAYTNVDDFFVVG